MYMWFTPTRVYVHGGSKRVGTLEPAGIPRAYVHGGSKRVGKLEPAGITHLYVHGRVQMVGAFEPAGITYVYAHTGFKRVVALPSCLHVRMCQWFFRCLNAVDK